MIFVVFLFLFLIEKIGLKKGFILVLKIYKPFYLSLFVDKFFNW